MYYKYKVANNKLITKSVRSLSLELDPNSSRPLLYQPGQYVAITLNDKSRPSTARCFSISSSPSEQRKLEFTVRVDGAFTTALERLQKGDEVLVRGPFGNFILNENTHQDVVMLAGGIGLAPFLSMMRYATSLSLKNKINLVYSCRSQEDIAFYDELTSMETVNPNLKVTYVVSKGTVEKLAGRRVISGRLTGENIDKLNFDYTSQTFMICGPSVYISSMDALLLEKGVPKSNILTEAFGQGSKLQTDKMISWPFNMYVMTGVALFLIAFFVMASDLYKTLPGLNMSSVVSTSTQTVAGNLTDKLNAIPPQVSTDITQPPIIKIKPATSVPVTPVTPVVPVAPVVTIPKPVIVTPAPVVITPTPTPAPKPTVVPKAKPRSTVS